MVIRDYMACIGSSSSTMKLNFQQITEQLVLAARRGDEAEASYLIPLYISGLEASLAGLSASEQSDVLSKMPALLKAQQDADWVLFADLLEEQS